MAHRRKIRWSYNLDYNLFIPKPKLLSWSQNSKKQYERIIREYEVLKGLAHHEVISAYGDPTTYNSIINSELSYNKKVNALKPLLKNFYNYWNDEFETLQEYLLSIDTSSSYEWESAGLRYNILRPFPSFLPRRDYDIFEYKLPNYKNTHQIKNRQPRKVPSIKQIGEYDASINKISRFLMCIIANKKSTLTKHRLEKFIQYLYEHIQSKPQPDILTPTLPKYHGCVNTSAGMVYW